MNDTFFRAVETTADAVIITDKHGSIEYVNPAFETITGYKKREALGKTPRVIKSGKHDLAFYKRLWSTILSGKSWRATVVNRKKNGELFYTDHTITPVKNKKGEITNFVGIWKDISEQKKLEKQRDEFVSLVGHELKTPITSLKLFIELLQKKSSSPYLSKMDMQVDKLTELVSDLLDTTRLNANQFPLNKQSFELNELIKEVVGDIQLTVGQKHRIIIERSPRATVVADRYRIGQVLTNLLTNAIKYSSAAKKILVCIERNKNKVVVGIRDFGIGIPENKQKYLFKKYFRVSETVSSTDRFNSLGLGLYISAEIVKRHGGKIWVKSIEGKGSTFHFSLPLYLNL